MAETTNGTLKLSGSRKTIAERMLGSLRASAQLSYHAEFDTTALVLARNAWKDLGIRIGFEDLIIRALCDVLPRHPHLNGTCNDEEATFSSTIDVAVAISAGDSLFAPVVFDAGEKSLPKIAEARSQLVERAQNRRLSIAEMTGGSITISNLGQTRVQHFTPIIQGQQIAIIGIGTMTNQPRILADGSIEQIAMMGLSLTSDHRFVDGQPSGMFLTDLCDVLENPVPGMSPESLE